MNVALGRLVQLGGPALVDSVLEIPTSGVLALWLSSSSETTSGGPANEVHVCKTLIHR